MQDKTALTTNPAGMRLIAQMTLYNVANWERLRRYIDDSYADPLLVAVPADERLTHFAALHEQVGRLRVGQVLALDEYHVVVLMESEIGAILQVHDVSVQEDHPHKITEYKRYEIG